MTRRAQVLATSPIEFSNISKNWTYCCKFSAVESKHAPEHFPMINAANSYTSLIFDVVSVTSFSMVIKMSVWPMSSRSSASLRGLCGRLVMIVSDSYTHFSQRSLVIEIIHTTQDPSPLYEAQVSKSRIIMKLQNLRAD